MPVTRHTTSAAPRWSPAIRLLVDRPRTVAWRPGAVAGGLLARGFHVRAYPIWPSMLHPRIAADVSHPPAAAWLQRTFERDAPRRPLVGPATWSAMRSRGLVVGPPSALMNEAVDHATGGDIGGRKLALYSAAGQSLSKAACFVFEKGADEPALVVKAMPDARHAARLGHETEIVEAFRERLGPGSRAAEALPLAPLFAGTAAANYVVVQSVDPLAASTGLLSDPAHALQWLREFQDGTTTTIRPWDEGDTEAALDPVRYAWQRSRPASANRVVSRARRLLQALEGQPVRRCGVHGDFWRDNIAQHDGRLRVYDWEWAHPEGPPFFDLWTTELGLLRRHAEEGSPRLLESLRAALAHVSAEQGRQGIDSRFALATLAPSLAHLVFRVRRATGVPGGAETESIALLAAVEALLT
jgi:Phosphotransferase enzyme family